MNKIFFIGHRWPEPNATAAGTRMVQLIQFFQNEGYEIHFGCAAQKPETWNGFQDSKVHSHIIELNSSSFDALIGSIDPSIVVFDRFMVEEQFGWRVNTTCPNALRILDTEDLHCLRKARQEAVRQRIEFKLSDVRNDTAIREIASIFRSDISLIISDFEKNLLKDFFGVPETQLMYLPFLPDYINRGIQTVKTFSERADFVSIGNFLHAPNRDSVLELKTKIWPQIRSRLPNAQLNVYGAYSEDKDRSLTNTAEGFIVKGYAEDAMEVIQSARVLLAPLRFGAGQKGKLLDAMICGTPTVTSTIGAESMHNDGKWNGFIEDECNLFAEKAAALYENEEVWDSAQSRGKELLNSVFNTEVHLLEFRNVLAECQANLNMRRSEHFIGSMMLHHTMKSSEYMSKWIEEKNKV